jgi:starch synthase (maltosyl-transferring)
MGPCGPRPAVRTTRQQVTKPRLVSVAADPAEARLAAALRAPRIAIERLAPLVDDGRFPVRACAGQHLTVEADIFIDGHDQIAAQVLWQDAGSEQALPLRLLGNDRWRAELTPGAPGRCHYVIEAWFDAWGSFRAELAKKVAAGVAGALEVQEGLALVREAAATEARSAAPALLQQLGALDGALAHDLLLAENTAAVMRAAQPRRFLARSARVEVDVERERAGFASWYELFPRSLGASGRHGTFDDVIGRLPAIRAMGFDVLYFPPIHPIGTANRKGRNNSLRAAAGEPGSPYAIGSSDGGHDAVHPELGGIEAFRRLQIAVAEAGMELALDFAVQFSPDHPWLRQHPGWFSWRPDGSLKHAENPPKKYEDISNCDFYAKDDPAALWRALRDVILHWVAEGVRIFRVDNPHTKPLPFWEWLIADVRARHPDVMFLSEAFTRPAMMYRLAKIGFSQSYTYFTWRHGKRELTDYLTELTTQAPAAFFRPHFFVNTPDINPYFLQTSGRPGFLIRAALATTLSGLWGLYSGFEHCESAPLPGKEEYLDSEKYQFRPRETRSAGDIVAEITRLNHIRRANPALRTHHGLRFYNAFNDQVLYYGKRTADRSNFVLVAVNLDPHHAHEAHFELPLWELGLPDDGALEAEELMRGTPLTWRGKVQHWRFTPELPFAIWRIRAPGR